MTLQNPDAARLEEIRANPDILPPAPIEDGGPPEAPALAPGLSVEGEAAGPPAAEPAAPERRLTKREEIAKQIAQKREQAVDTPANEMPRDERGLAIPPFIAQAQAEAAREAEAAATAAATPEAPAANPAAPAKTYTLKVYGNDIAVKSFDELARLAETDPEEAKGLSEVSLVRLAQKHVAAQMRLDEAKQARPAARAPADQPAHAEPDPTAPADPAKTKATKAKEVIEKVQFGDPDEAAEAIDSLINERVQARLTETQVDQRITRAEDEISATVRTFEAANSDILSDPDLSEPFYSRFVVAEIKKDLVASGKVTQAVADEALTGKLNDAVSVYTAALASGLVKVRTPDLILGDAAVAFRTKFRISPPTPSNAPAPATAPVHDRLAAKRALPQQPTRSAPPPPPVRPEKKLASAVIAEIAARRGRRPATLPVT